MFNILMLTIDHDKTENVGYGESLVDSGFDAYAK